MVGRVTPKGIRGYLYPRSPPDPLYTIGAERPRISAYKILQLHSKPLAL